MKNLNSFVRNSPRFVPVLALALTVAHSSAYARMGGTSSGGGNGLASKFFNIAKSGVNKLKMICEDDSTKQVCSYLVPLQDALLRDQVTAEDHVTGPDGKERDAINNGKDLVTVSRTRWDEAQNSPDNSERWLRCAIHEFASTIPLEHSDTYNVSDAIVDSIKQAGFDLTKIAGKLGFEAAAPAGLGVNVEKTSQNSDGSVTFSGLRFSMGEANYVIAQAVNAVYFNDHDFFGKPVGRSLCERIGMSYISQETDRGGDYEVDNVATFDIEGHFAGIKESNTWVDSITCRPSASSDATEVRISK